MTEKPTTLDQLESRYTDMIGFTPPKIAKRLKLGMQVDELKALIKDLHKNGIEVFLDVVFNHTAEGNERGPYISFRGIDNRTFYLLDPRNPAVYANYSGDPASAPGSTREVRADSDDGVCVVQDSLVRPTSID